MVWEGITAVTTSELFDSNNALSNNFKASMDTYELLGGTDILESRSERMSQEITDIVP